MQYEYPPTLVSLGHLAAVGRDPRLLALAVHVEAELLSASIQHGCTAADSMLAGAFLLFERARLSVASGEDTNQSEARQQAASVMLATYAAAVWGSEYDGPPLVQDTEPLRAYRRHSSTGEYGLRALPFWPVFEAGRDALLQSLHATEEGASVALVDAYPNGAAPMAAVCTAVALQCARIAAACASGVSPSDVSAGAQADARGQHRDTYRALALSSISTLAELL